MFICDLSASKFLQGKGSICLWRGKGSDCPNQVTPKDDSFHRPLLLALSDSTSDLGLKEKVTERLGLSSLGRVWMKSYQ